MILAEISDEDRQRIITEGTRILMEEAQTRSGG